VETCEDCMGHGIVSAGDVHSVCEACDGKGQVEIPCPCRCSEGYCVC
jgi:hypothetical protein